MESNGMNNTFKEWNVQSIEKDYLQWRETVDWIEVYIVDNNCDLFDTQTHIGSCAWSNIRLEQHNNNLPGGPQDTKRAAGCWNRMFYLIVPPLRNYNISDIIEYGNEYRGLKSRCEKLILVARLLGISFRISKHIMDENSKHYAQNIKDYIYAHYTPSEIESIVF